MKTQVAPTTTERELEDAAEAAVYLIAGGYPVALPTETVYGLAGWALNPDALLRIFQTKARPLFDPLIVHLPNMEWLRQVCDIPKADLPLVERLTAAFWPGPLTIILPRKKIVPDLVTAGLPTVAVRMSAHPVFAQIVSAFGQPLAAPSANRFGRISPTQASHVMAELGGRIRLIVDGGPCMLGVESTIVSIRGDSMWILRNGPVTAEQLAEHGTVGVAPTLRTQPPSAPGQLKSHYAPETPLALVEPGGSSAIMAPEPWGLLAFRSAENAEPYKHVEVLSVSGNLSEAAATLFAKLRALDAVGVKKIVAERVPESGLGAAIMDRLRKAAGIG